MKLAISNIAWLAAEEEMAAQIIQEEQIGGVEVAPTKLWPKPLEASDAELDGYRQFWAAHGIQVVAVQSLLFGRPDLTLFENAAKRRETLTYLHGMMRLSARLGARALVFGSPKNRKVNGLPPETVAAIAVDFFYAAGELAAAYDLLLCIEPNPVQYECDYITTSAQGLALVREVNNPGFGLHLDAAGLTLSAEPLADALTRCVGIIQHFHASEPFLGSLGKGGIDHATLAATLRRLAYPHWVSVEMRQNPEVDTASELRRVLTYLQKMYG